MKSTLVISAAALILFRLAAAQPHGAHHHRHHRRDVVTQYATVTQAPVHVIVYVDQNGVPVSTHTVTGGVESATPAADSMTPPAYGEPSTPTPNVSPAPPPPPPSSSVQQSSATTPALQSPAAGSSSTPPQPPPSPVKQSSATAPPPQSPKAESSSAPPSPAPSPDGQAPPPAAGGHGITYTPYTAGGLCKTYREVEADFHKIDGFSLLRLYGTDCNQLDTVVPQARAKGMRLFLGIANANVTANRIDDEVATFARYFGNGGWGIVDTISVGNEPVNSGMPLGTVLAAVDKARAGLRAKGYNGPVVVADTFIAMKAHPEICQRSDYAATNLHAFFDGNVEAARAGAFVAEQALQVKQACGGKRVVVTETGWPTQGGTNRKAVPSHENQKAAVSSIKSECGAKQVPVIFFAAFNELWKKDHAATHGCEKFWGLLG